MTVVFQQLSKYQRKYYQRIDRILRNEAKHRAKYPSKEDKLQARAHIEAELAQLIVEQQKEAARDARMAEVTP